MKLWPGDSRCCPATSAHNNKMGGVICDGIQFKSSFSPLLLLQCQIHCPDAIHLLVSQPALTRRVHWPQLTEYVVCFRRRKTFSCTASALSDQSMEVLSSAYIKQQLLVKPFNSTLHQLGKFLVGLRGSVHLLITTTDTLRKGYEPAEFDVTTEPTWFCCDIKLGSTKWTEKVTSWDHAACPVHCSGGKLWPLQELSPSRKVMSSYQAKVSWKGIMQKVLQKNIITKYNLKYWVLEASSGINASELSKCPGEPIAILVSIFLFTASPKYYISTVFSDCEWCRIRL